jgi:hypothetical protein
MNQIITTSFHILSNEIQYHNISTTQWTQTEEGLPFHMMTEAEASSKALYILINRSVISLNILLFATTQPELADSITE